MSPAVPLVSLEKVTKDYGGGAGAPPVHVLRELSLQIEGGESVAIVGPSGSGKSTLLNIMGTLDRPSAGRVTLDGQDLMTLREEELATVRNRKIGFVFQAHHLLPQCTVLENVLVPTLADSRQADRAESTSRAAQLLQRVGLGDRLKH